MCLAPGDLCLRMMEPMHYITALIVGLTVWLFTRHFRKNNHDLKEILWSGSFWKWSGSLDIIMHSVVFVVILTVSTSILVCLQSNNSKPNYGDLKKTITASFMCRSHPGMVVAVVKDRKTVFSEAFGVLLPGSKVKVTRETKFMIAYLTKAFTAALLVNVFANNPRNKSYDLKTPLRDILGSNFSFADDERTRYASAEDLLSHLIAWPKKGLMRFNPSLKRSDFIRFARYWKTELTFRGKAKYCSVAYTLAAAITEYLGEKPWENLITERIFNPLGMTSTGFAFSSNFSQDDVAKPYYTVRQKISIDPLFTKLWNSRCGSGCIMTTIDDMAKWINFILSHGKNASGHQVMPLGEVKSLTKTRTYLRSSRRDFIRKPLFPVTSVTDEYALGWRNGFYKGYKTVSHTGSSPGYSSILMMYPHENMGIFVSMTGDDYAFSYRLALVHYISDVMLGHPPWLNTSTLCTFPEPWKRQKQHPSPVYDVDLKPALPYIEYIGVYKSPLYGEVFVNFNSSTFFLQGFYGFGSWQLLPQKQENNFYGRGIWTTDFWDVSGFQFVTKDNDSSTITKVLIDDLDPRDYPLVFEKEFNGGAELLCGNVKKHEVKLPDEGSDWTVRLLLCWVRDNIVKERPELFMQGDTVRPGILVLINDADWELMGELDYKLEDNDKLVFISTLHGG